MFRASTLILAVLTIASLLVACGDDDDEEQADVTQSASATLAVVSPTERSTDAPDPSPTREPPAAILTPAPTNTVEGAIIEYATTVGLDIPREMSEPLYCQDIPDTGVEDTVGKVCILGAPPAGAGAVPGTPVLVEAGVTFSDGVWTLTVEMVDGAWSVTSSEPSTDGL